MQYFRNMPRRPMDCQSPRGSDMFPLCRTDCMSKPDLSREQNSCYGGCEKTKAVKQEIPERSPSCGCENNNPVSGNEQGMHQEYRENRGCGCQGACHCDSAVRAEDYGCTGLSMAFVPEQDFDELNTAEEALCRGSLFRNLDMPFYGQKRRGCK